MTNTHAHVSTTAVDCDGPVHRSYVMAYNDDELAQHNGALLRGEIAGYGTGQAINDFSEIRFRERVLNSLVSVYAVGHGLRLTATDAGFEYTEDTDEGYRSGEARWCSDACDLGQRSYRDVFAEAAGY